MPTLLHFAAKYNFINLSKTLLKCPGAVESLMTKNLKGFTPMGIANTSGHLKLAGVFVRTLFSNCFNYYLVDFLNINHF